MQRRENSKTRLFPVLLIYFPDKDHMLKLHFYTLTLTTVFFFLLFCRPAEPTPPPQQLSTTPKSDPIAKGDINVTELISKLLTGYDKRLRPNFGGMKKSQLFISCKKVSHMLYIRSNVRSLVNQSGIEVIRSVSQLVIWSVGWLVSRSVGRSVGRSVSQSVSQSVSCQSMLWVLLPTFSLP